MSDTLTSSSDKTIYDAIEKAASTDFANAVFQIANLSPTLVSELQSFEKGNKLTLSTSGSYSAGYYQNANTIAISGFSNDPATLIHSPDLASGGIGIGTTASALVGTLAHELGH